MKIRIRADSIRLRLSQKEVSKIESGTIVEDVTRFPGGSKFSYSLQPSGVTQEISARFEKNQIIIMVPNIHAATWAHSAEVSMKANLPIDKNSDERLYILIEKDFLCLKTRENEIEDESDLFVNPNAAHGSCG